MRKNAADIKINVWINEERLDTLEEAGMAHMAKEEFAGMKLLAVTMTEEQKDIVLHRFPSAKFDSSTTRSIELLPKQAKDKLLDLSIKMHSTGPDVVDRFLDDA
jgi:hypothetical protein